MRGLHVGKNSPPSPGSQQQAGMVVLEKPPGKGKFGVPTAEPGMCSGAANEWGCRQLRERGRPIITP